MHNNNYQLFFAFCSFLLCTQFTSQDSSIAGRQKPDVNFYGTLVDITNKSYRVENITISGRYKQIPVYQKPPTPNINPNIHTTLLDLAEIKEIKTVFPSKKEKEEKVKLQQPEILTFNKIDYIEIDVISHDQQQTKNRYIIERRKKIYCDEVNKAGPINKKISFEALRSLTIKGYKEQEKKVNKKKLKKKKLKKKKQSSITQKKNKLQ